MSSTESQEAQPTNQQEKQQRQQQQNPFDDDEEVADPNAPIWLSTEYDDKHREESEPLFGTGELNLQDPDTKEQSKIASAKTTSTITSNDPHPALNAINRLRNVFNFYGAIDDDNDDNAHHHYHDSKNASSTNEKDALTTAKPNKSRVGQNLLLRSVLPSSVDNENDINFKDRIDKNKETDKINDTTMLTIIDTNNANEASALFGSSVTGGRGGGGTKNASTGLIHHPNHYKPHMPRHDPILYMFNLLQGLTTVASFGLIVTQLLIPCLVLLHHHSFHDITVHIGTISIAFKFYIVMFCFLFIIVETDIIPLSFVRNAILLQGFISRGYLYSFIGLICVQQAQTDRMKDILFTKQQQSLGQTQIQQLDGVVDVDWTTIYMEVSSWFMLGIGIVYMILGLCCLKRVRDQLKEKEINAWREYRIQYRQWKELYSSK